ncbi:type II secretion system minor pseudopilin GspK [Ectopseudomonas guguanensis]|uniref:Type II secretion system protein K n=1 Tax=Ectopseudomonas guguanensis TaxID=1198456 RepID=A0A1H0JZR6_9GAMM|nr:MULTISPECIES: type II secretion system minor pseudopilin GspK [Pseudomonas]MPT18293.1 general secretion pathway protein GspK [Pseudomonas sp.]WJH56322.1 general secretion pathway protein GspK [Pseudomonas guguanensis]SDO49039.1 general secretion pathway protein K [Pseudomonas guguanensis]
MRRQSGVALITVLLVVAVVTVVCAGLIARQQLSIRSSANQLHVNQAWHYALGGETLAKAVLERDVRRGDPRQPVDHLLEPWARPLTFPLDEGGELRVRIVDPSARFNLNSLVRQGRPNELAVLRLRRLLLRLGIDKPYAERLLDWLDTDSEPQGGNGAEDGQYLLATPPYRAANREVTDVSELRLLLEMDEADYRRLLPFVSALPGEALLNVNTASAMVLSSLSDGLTPDTATALIAARGAEGYPSPAAFAAQPALAGMGEQVVQGLAVGSQYFEVFSEVSLGERRVVLRSLLQRSNDGQVSVLARDLGQGGMPPPSVEEERE